VRNLPDGRVEVLLEGNPDAVAEVEAWCRRGPRMALVRSVDVTDETETDETADTIEARDEQPDEQPEFEIR
jgi:acylphosphatase